MERYEVLFVWDDELLFEKTGEGRLELWMCHERNSGCYVGRWWVMVLVGESQFDFSLSHGSVRLLNVLGDPP